MEFEDNRREVTSNIKKREESNNNANNKGQTLTNQEEVLERWKEYPMELLGSETTAVQDLQKDEEELICGQENTAPPLEKSTKHLERW